jgi:hypothetical protein
MIVWKTFAIVDPSFTALSSTLNKSSGAGVAIFLDYSRFQIHHQNPSTLYPMIQ